MGPSLAEEPLYKLIGCCFLPLQKAGFFMLNQMYETMIPNVLYKKDLEEEFQ